MTQPSTSEHQTDDGTAISRWTDLVYAEHTPQQRACLDASWSIADIAGREVAAARRDPPDAPMGRGSAWCRIALAAYHRLMAAGAHTATEAPTPCVADPDRIRAWLASPSTDPGFGEHTVAQVWDYDETFTRDAPHNLTNLIEQAQQAGVFGLPNHRIVVWYLPDDEADMDGFLLTVDTPSGHRLCSDFLTYTEVITPGLSGTDAAVDCLTGLAATVDDTLTPRTVQQARADAAPGPAALTGQTAAPPRLAAAFPRPSTTATTPATPAAPPKSARSTQPGHSR